MPEAAAIEFVPLTVPTDADAPGGEDFRINVDIRNRVLTHTRGEDATLVTPAQSLGSWQDQTDEEIHGWLARADGEAVGRMLLYVPLEAGSKRAQLCVEILPEHQGLGIGRRALAFLEGRAAARGRTILQSWTEHAPQPGPGVPARSGFGLLPRDHEARFAAAAGYELEQVYRISTLEIRDETGGALHEHGRDPHAASSGYRFVSWVGAAPDEHVADYALLKARMSTDAPSAGAVVDEEVWDAARVRRMETSRRGIGATLLVGAAQHVGSGRLAGFTELLSFRTANGLIDQGDTLVGREHRGHRLGMLMKCELLTVARETFPEGTRIVTGNAEENRPMLAVNEEMGFAPVRYAGEWQKRTAGMSGRSGSSGS